VLAATKFWEEKTYSTWSETDVKKMLTDSPWARKVGVLTPDLSLASRTGGLSGGAVGSGGRAGGVAGGGGVGGDGAGKIGGGTFVASPSRTELAVRWTSALPVKQALARVRLGSDAMLSAEEQRLLAQDEPFYRVAVVGLPPKLIDGEETVRELLAATRLKRRNGAAIGAVDILPKYESDRLTIEFKFPKTAPIMLDDKEVEFVTKLGRSEVKKKFKLAEMVFGDQLAL
jgi:hypothetical protein